MDTQQEKQAVESLLNKYAEAINAGNGSLMPNFYTQRAVFMPNGRKNISRNDLDRDSKNLFKKVAYSIEFAVQETTIDGNYAFVQAAAQTTITKLATGEKTTKGSRDFFVLQKEQEHWKIFRYIFNNVNAG
ncbi:YybH family protein [Pedobacter immunditicola]|uniref:YybH family protein n=1 Tax=Pedobacter immunditicola TaxID=3133440 RepID=UPI00309AA268